MSDRGEARPLEPRSGARPQFAQTLLQLLDQLQATGRPADTLADLHRAYQFSMQLFSGMYRPSGGPFVEHGVGTASILAWAGAPDDLVAAGLLHAAYDHGDFGTNRMGRGIPLQLRRSELREVVGERIEALVYRYHEFPWGPGVPGRYLNGDDTERDADRPILLARLANTLEDHLDLGVLYCPNAEVRRAAAGARGPDLVALARALDQPELAEQLELVFEHTLSARVPAVLRRTGSPRAFLQLPPSYRLRFGQRAGRLPRPPAPDRIDAPEAPDSWLDTVPATSEVTLDRPAKSLRQLYVQLLRAGRYDGADLGLIRRAYEVGVQRLALRFQSTETPFESHGIAVASILVLLGARAELVAAALVHNLYFWGDFADGVAHGATPARRARVRAVLGEEVESRLAALPGFRRDLRKGGMDRLADDASAFEGPQCDLLLLHASDRVDHHLDGAYRDLDEAVRRRWLEEAPVLSDAVAGIGQPRLATLLCDTSRVVSEANASSGFRSGRARSFLVVPRSARKRRIVGARSLLSRGRKAGGPASGAAR